MSSLNDEQRKMIEEKRKAAQAKLLAKFASKNVPQQVIGNSNKNDQCTFSKAALVMSPSPRSKTVETNKKKPLKKIKPTIVCGTCELISKERFTVHVAYHQQLIDTFKTILSKSYGIFLT